MSPCESGFVNISEHIISHRATACGSGRSARIWASLMDPPSERMLAMCPALHKRSSGDPERIQAGSREDPGGIQTGPRRDSDGTQAGSRGDPGGIYLGTASEWAREGVGAARGEIRVCITRESAATESAASAAASTSEPRGGCGLERKEPIESSLHLTATAPKSANGNTNPEEDPKPDPAAAAAAIATHDDGGIGVAQHDDTGVLGPLLSVVPAADNGVRVVAGPALLLCQFVAIINEEAEAKLEPQVPVREYVRTGSLGDAEEILFRERDLVARQFCILIPQDSRLGLVYPGSTILILLDEMQHIPDKAASDEQADWPAVKPKLRSLSLLTFKSAERAACSTPGLTDP
eukprot:CAMPEP_0181231006 /NCGR_PEP_ID=MMETSP1096-20121128/34837_1 /TAXON_ID=156174 ORGANISM="Chrysochromulina ericina, Strain CCMP281" /NCGR_SAMPLE_ID=MMETSP1096 /ASSEMBLY_ACC=CAM_ASM_000453 /LENGTH=348 /DNA_ID=CAMNT_0023324941 /DNA_START=271 /DNA_END=1315 /DNA_ORIENTATION=-